METQKEGKRIQNIPLWIVLGMIGLSLIGLGDSSYLSARHFQAGSGLVSCGTEGCGVVLNSEYSEVAGIPLALLGATYYGIVFIGMLMYVATRKTRLLRYISIFTGIGFLASLYFVYLQLFVIHSICTFCMVSAVSSTLLLILGMIVLTKMQSDLTQGEPELE